MDDQKLLTIEEIRTAAKACNTANAFRVWMLEQDVVLAPVSLVNRTLDELDEGRSASDEGREWRALLTPSLPWD